VQASTTQFNLACALTGGYRSRHLALQAEAGAASMITPASQKALIAEPRLQHAKTLTWLMTSSSVTVVPNAPK
jgi:hypothetical protein